MGRHTAKIAGSILSGDFASLGNSVRELEAAGVDWIHVDVMDGHFVPNLTIGPPVIEAIRRCTSLPFDVHLMVERPDDLLDSYLKAGANWITVHSEACRHLQRTLAGIREGGARAGVSLNPATPLSALEEILPDVDLILLMTVNPGFGGQRFIPQMMEKVRRCREMCDRAGVFPEISVDGGLNTEIAPEIVPAGASVLVVGSALFGHPGGLAAGVAALRSAARSRR